MRSLWFLLLGAVPAFSQPFTIGVKAGVPLTDFFNTVRSPNFGFNSNTTRYILGGTAELRLPAGFGIEFDALFRRLHYDGSGNLIDVLTNNRTTGNAWEFPLLVKYRFPTKVIRPYVDVGVAWDTLTGLKQDITNTFAGRNTTTTTSTSTPQELNNTTTTGFVFGFGLDVHALLHISPEVRYTRWGSQHFADTSGLLHSNQNQAEFLLGITF